MIRKRVLTAEEIRDVESRYLRGQGLRFISFATGISQERIREELVAKGVKIRRKGRHASGNWGYSGGIDP